MPKKWKRCEVIRPGCEKKVVKRKAVSKKTTQKKAVVKKAASKGQVTNVAPTPPVSGPGDASRDLPESPVSGKKRVTPRVAKVIDSNGVVTMSNEKHQESGEGGSVAGFWPKVIISLLIVIIVFLYLRARVHDGSEAVNESSPQHAQEAPAAPDLDTVKSTVTNQGSVTVAPPMEAGQPERAGVLPGSAPVTGGRIRMASLTVQISSTEPLPRKRKRRQENWTPGQPPQINR